MESNNSSIEEEEEIDDEIDINKLENEFNDNPFSLDNYITLLSYYKSKNDIDKVEELREKSHNFILFPEVLWNDWIEDKIKLAQTNELKKEVLKLFDMSIEDFPCKNYFLEFLFFEIFFFFLSL